MTAIQVVKKVEYLLVDPQDETIKEGTIIYKDNKDKLRKIYEVLGCSCVDKVTFDDDKHDIVLDDDGFHNMPWDKPRKFYSLKDLGIYPGKGMVFGVKETRAGATWASVTITKEKLRELITFHDQKSALHYAAKLECAFDEYGGDTHAEQ